MEGEKEPVSFDILFEDIGSFGIYQLTLFLMIGILPFTGTETIFLNFVGYTPEHWCRVDELKTYPFETQKHVSLPIKENEDGGDIVYSSCKMYGLNYSQFGDNDFLNWNRSIFITENTQEIDCPNGWVYDRSIIEESITTKWNLVCGDAWMVQFVGTMSILGFMIGSVFVGPLSDKYGRRLGLISFLFIKILSGFLSAFAPNYPTIVIARILLAVGSLGCYVTGFSLLQEIIGPSYRTVVGIGFQVVYSLGFMCDAGIAYFLRDDVTVQVAMAAMPCVMVFAIWFLPESPRWLMLNGQIGKAEKVIRKIAKVNGRQLKDDFDVSHVSVSRDTKYNTSLIDIFKSSILRKRGAILCLHWFTDSLIFYALSLNTAALSGDIYLNTFISGAVEIPANILAIFFMNWKYIGRRWTAVLSLVIAGVASLICVPIIITEVSPTTVTILSMFGKAGATMGFGCMYLYTSELFPTEVRNIALGMCSFMSRISGMAAPYVGGPLGEVWKPLPSIVFGSFGILAGSFSVLLPETLGTNLPDTISDIEGENRSERKYMDTKDIHVDPSVDGHDNAAYSGTSF